MVFVGVEPEINPGLSRGRSSTGRYEQRLMESDRELHDAHDALREAKREADLLRSKVAARNETIEAERREVDALRGAVMCLQEDATRREAEVAAMRVRAERSPQTKAFQEATPLAIFSSMAASPGWETNMTPWRRSAVQEIEWVRRTPSCSRSCFGDISREYDDAPPDENFSRALSTGFWPGVFVTKMGAGRAARVKQILGTGETGYWTWYAYRAAMHGVVIYHGVPS